MLTHWSLPTQTGRDWLAAAAANGSSSLVALLLAALCNDYYRSLSSPRYNSPSFQPTCLVTGVKLPCTCTCTTSLLLLLIMLDGEVGLWFGVCGSVITLNEQALSSVKKNADKFVVKKRRLVSSESESVQVRNFFPMASSFIGWISYRLTRSVVHLSNLILIMEYNLMGANMYR